MYKSTVAIRAYPEFFFDYSITPPICLPTSVNVGGLIDCTTVSDAWRQFLDPSTGDLHVGQKYYDRYLEEMRDRDAEYDLLKPFR